MENEIIGKTSQNRNDFYPEEFLENLFGDDDEMMIMDSNNLDSNWREMISSCNSNSSFQWNNLEQARRHYDDDFDEDSVESDDENDENLESSLPKRVLAYSSTRLIKLLGKHLKTSVDGTFKSSCKLFKQNFVWMVKIYGHWIPIIHGWLPDKTELSYKVFILLVKQKLAELGIQFDIDTLICDFELAIVKAFDDMTNCKIETCFFHLAKALKTKVDKKGFKTLYETDIFFQGFIKQCSALAHLPLADLEKGLTHIENKFNFNDKRTSEFKTHFIDYIRDFWINGCYPPSVWNCWSRSQDLTNNNQVNILNIPSFLL